MHFELISSDFAGWRGQRGMQRRPASSGASVIYDGGSRTAVATIGSVTLQIVPDWVMPFSALGPNGLINIEAWYNP